MDWAWEVAKTIADAFRAAPSGAGGVPRDTGLLQDASINALSAGYNDRRGERCSCLLRSIP